MNDQPQDPQTLLARLVYCLATPTTSTVGDYFDAEQSLDDYCAAHGFIWAFNDDGVPYLEKASARARRLVKGIAELVSREAEMIPARPAIQTSNGIQAYLVDKAPCGHDLVVWVNNDDWHDGTSYCQMPDCGAGYTLIFDTGVKMVGGQKLIGVEPFGR